MGSLCLWEVGLAFVVSGASISEWPSQHDRRATGRLLVPGIIAGASVPPSGAALSAGTSWVGARMHPSAWRRLVRAPLSAAAHPASPSCAPPRPPRLASAPWPCAHLPGAGWPLRSGWCGSLPAPRAHPLRRGVSGHAFCLVPARFVAGVICSSSGCAGGLCVPPKSVCLPSISSPVPPLRPRICPGQLSAWTRPPCFKGCALLAGFVCPTALGSGSPSAVWGRSP